MCCLVDFVVVLAVEWLEVRQEDRNETSADTLLLS